MGRVVIRQIYSPETLSETLRENLPMLQILNLLSRFTADNRDSHAKLHLFFRSTSV